MADGVITDAPDETWRGVDDALRRGLRGLESGLSLAVVVKRERGLRHTGLERYLSKTPLEGKQINFRSSNDLHRPWKRWLKLSNST